MNTQAEVKATKMEAIYIGPPRGEVHTNHEARTCHRDLMPGEPVIVAHSAFQKPCVDVKRCGRWAHGYGEGWYRVDAKHIQP